MSHKTVIQHPNEILRQKSIDVQDLSEAKTIARNLTDTLNDPNLPGTGLAAPQIGINKRIFVARQFINREENEIFKDIVMINPIIIKLSENTNTMLEACLSIKDTYGYVRRPNNIKVLYTDLKGDKVTLKTGGFLARVIQHEFDHLEGVLFIDKVEDDKTYTEKEVDEMLKRGKI
jgi:peptide deformylase